jgi:cytochrome P450
LRGRIPEHYQRVGQLIQGQIANLDPPAHTPPRRAAQRTFSHRRIRDLEPKIELIANDVIDGLVGRGACDLLHDFATEVTLRVITTLLDVPADMLPGLNAWIDDVFKIQAPLELEAADVTIDDDELVARYERLYEGYRTYSAFVEDRRTSPGDDLASAMLTLTGPDGGRALSNDDVLGYMLGLTAAGTDTTANLIVNVVRYFTEYPDQLGLVLDDTRLWDNAVSEGLRRSGITWQKYRISKVPSEVLGLKIPARARVSVSLAAANTDPSKFSDPLRFDVCRANASDHVGLGRGRHYCLGAPVVMPEARIALRVLYERLPGLQADLDQELEFMPVREMRAVLSQHASWEAPAIATTA